jgi:hypothetical protein
MLGVSSNVQFFRIAYQSCALDSIQIYLNLYLVKQTFSDLGEFTGIAGLETLRRMGQRQYRGSDNEKKSHLIPCHVQNYLSPFLIDRILGNSLFRAASNMKEVCLLWAFHSS